MHMAEVSDFSLWESLAQTNIKQWDHIQPLKTGKLRWHLTCLQSSVGVCVLMYFVSSFCDYGWGDRKHIVFHC